MIGAVFGGSLQGKPKVIIVLAGPDVVDVLVPETEAMDG